MPQAHVPSLSPPSSTTTSGRLTFIDVARTYAVLLALLSHALSETGLFVALGDSGGYVRQFTRTATPLFVFMFGFMAAYAYGQRAISDVWPRLLRRSAQCYLAYALTSFAAVVGGQYGAAHFLRSLAFFGDSRFGNILRVYALILPILPLFLALRARYGWGALYAALTVVLASFPLLDALDATDFGGIGRPMNILFGVGTRQGGPSAYHAISFVLAGMIVATAFGHARRSDRWHFVRIAGLLLVTAGAFSAFTVSDDARTVWTRFTDFTYRADNHAAYYLVGIATSILTMSACLVAFGSRPAPRILAGLLPVGRWSLFAYTFGNVFLSLFGGMVVRLGAAYFLLLFAASTVGATRLVDAWSRRQARAPIGPSLPEAT